MKTEEPGVPESFEQEVRECLAHLYDFTAMQSDPLVHKLAPHLSGLERIQTARKILVETIERLNEAERANLQSRQSRLYNILLLRYIEEHSTPTVLQQLALSERQYYRELQRAIWILSQLLWERIAQTPSSPEPAHLDSISVQSEIERAYQLASTVETNLATFIATVMHSIGPLAEQHQVAIQSDVADPAIIVNIPQASLKQAVLYIINEILKVMRTGGEIILGASRIKAETQISLMVAANDYDLAAIQTSLEADKTVEYLVGAVGAKLLFEQAEPDGLIVHLRLPHYQKNILVIDDNPDFIALVERYLTNSSYTVLGIQDGFEGIQLSQKLQPLAIILDVMMPEYDGWDVLQHLKNHPDTQHIPILVCSVLDIPELALSLGADNYLKKPPGRVDLLTILAQLEL
ncbi:MAG: response regulator [Chloroflexi bacterium]|nr:response regulator [Chloroflexota bacterium]